MMRVAVTGANSASGRALLRRAHERGGPALVACVRSERAAAQLPSLEAPSGIARIDFDELDTLESAFAGVAAVVHLSGILIEGPGSSYERANLGTARAAIAAAERVGAKKLVLVSAIGADPESRNRYYASKGLAERCAAESPLPCTVLRAPLLLGRGTEGARALARQARQATCALLGGGGQRVQPLDVSDLASAALRVAEPGVADGRILDLVGPESLPYRELVERARRCTGRTGAPRILPIPVRPLRAALWLRGRVSGPGFSGEVLDVLLDEHSVDPTLAARALGIELTPLDATLRASLEDAS